MNSLNIVSMLGRMTKDPELKKTSNGKDLVTFTIAQNRKIGENEQSHFFDCVAFGKTAEAISKYFQKGNRISIVGTLAQSRWQDKDGSNRSAIKIEVERFYFVDKRNDSVQNDAPMGATPEEEFNDGSVPF